MVSKFARHLWTRCSMIIGLTMVSTVAIEAAEPPAPELVPETALRDLLKRDAFEFAFVVKQGEGSEQKIVARPTIISSKTGGYAIDSTSDVETTVPLPPAHVCEIKILDSVDDEVTVEFQVERTVGLVVTATDVMWETQHHRTNRKVNLGEPVTLRIPRHEESGDPSMELTVMLRPFKSKVTRR